MLCGGGGVHGAVFLYKSNISNPGDIVVTDEMRPTQPQGPIPELNPPTSEHQHARRDRRHHDDTTGVGRAADHGPRDGRGKNNGDYIVTGKGKNFYLCAAQQVQRQKEERVGLFLSRVRPDFRCADIVRYVRHVTGLTVRCEPVPTRYDTYASYCIRASPNEIDRSMNGNLWPRGVIVKQYTKLI